MKKLGVVFVVLGVIAAVIALFPGLAGEKSPAEGFGWQQTVALAVGLVLLLLGILMCAKGGVCCCCAAPKAPEAPAEPPAQE